MADMAELRFLYVGTADTARDVSFYESLGARLCWRFRRFGADVAAVDFGAGPRLLLADHRPAGSVLPIYAVDSLARSVETVARSGGKVLRSLETPEGPACVVGDPSGTEVGLLEVVRPGAMDTAYSIHAAR